MTTVSIIGTGNMGTAIAGIVEAGGNSAELIGRDGGAISGDLVVLAVPHPAIADIVAERRAELAGKVVIDISNPLAASFDRLAVPADASAAAELAEALPESKVLKAFNTNFAATLATKTVGENPTTVLIAGDDEGAKAQLAEVVRGGGVQAVDAGSLERARELESIGFVQLMLALQEKIGWTTGFALVK